MTVLVAIYSQFGGWCIPDDQLEGLRRGFPEHTFIRADSDREVLERIPFADIVFGTRVTPEQLAAAGRLQWIHSPAAGIGNMLFPEMIESPVAMTNSRGNSAVTIAARLDGWYSLARRIWGLVRARGQGPGARGEIGDLGSRRLCRRA